MCIPNLQLLLFFYYTCFFSMHSVTNWAKLTQITNTAAKVIGLSPTRLNYKAIARIADTIAQDITHPLNHHFTVLPSERRYRSLRCSGARFSKSLVPAAIASPKQGGSLTLLMGTVTIDRKGRGERKGSHAAKGLKYTNVWTSNRLTIQLN